VAWLAWGVVAGLLGGFGVGSGVVWHRFGRVLEGSYLAIWANFGPQLEVPQKFGNLPPQSLWVTPDDPPSRPAARKAPQVEVSASGRLPQLQGSASGRLPPE
jgi:hypothetical protein